MPGEIRLLVISHAPVLAQQGHFTELVDDRRGWRGNTGVADRYQQHRILTLAYFLDILQQISANTPFTMFRKSDGFNSISSPLRPALTKIVV